jgi:sugar phosphate isomerase/epimerase
MVEAVLNSGLIVGSLNCGFSQEISVESESAYQTFLSEFTAMIAFAKRINCPNITSQPGTLNNAKNIRQSLDRIISRAPQLNALVKESGISYSLEGHHGSILESIENCDYLMQKAFPLIGLTYDPSHFAMQGIPLADTTSLLDYAMHVHIRNAKNGVMQANMTDGEIQIDTFAKMLQEKNWNGYIAIEYFRGFDIDCQNTLAIAKQLIAQGSTN